LHELVNNARVIGGINAESAQAGRDLYATFVKGEIVLTDATTAEMVKLMENTYRDVNIAIANEFARLADRFGINIWEAISIANRHPRVKILNPGPGVGGHCISVDPWFLVEAAPDITSLILTSRKVNDNQPHYVVDLVHRAIGEELNGRKIAVLGLSYKQDVDDLRESPSVEVADLLSQAGAIIKAYEPYKPEAQFSHFSTVNSLEEALTDAEIIVLLVAHKQFRELDAQRIMAMTPARFVVDAVNAWSKPEWEKSGFKFYRIGVGK
jgi:UDP-N-acetyl-D-mannosaminuronic acid dehydrogenase